MLLHHDRVRLLVCVAKVKQRRRTSLIEAVANVAAGLVVAIAGQCIIFPALGIVVSLGQTTEIALFMTAISIVRQFILRRLFEHLRVTGRMP